MSLLLLACVQEAPLVTFSGVVSDTRDGEDGASEVLVETRGPTYDAVGEGTTDGRGFFEVDVVANTVMFVTFSGEDYAPTGFTGIVGAEDFAVEDGVLYMRTAEEVAALAEVYAGCENADLEGVAVVEGEIRFHIPGYEVDDGGDWPTAPTGYAALTDEAGESWDACYLNEDATAWDEEAEVTGVSGRFAVFGDFSGPAALTVGYEIEGEPYYATDYTVHVPEGGIAPVYPAYVPFPE